MKEQKDDISWNWDFIAEAKKVGISKRISACIINHRNPKPALVTRLTVSNPNIPEMTAKIGCMVLRNDDNGIDSM